jgi:hypothetical protein
LQIIILDACNFLCLFLEVIVAGLNCILFKIYIKIIFFYF